MSPRDQNIGLAWVPYFIESGSSLCGLLNVLGGNVVSELVEVDGIWTTLDRWAHVATSGAKVTLSNCETGKNSSEHPLEGRYTLCSSVGLNTTFVVGGTHRANNAHVDFHTTPDGRQGIVPAHIRRLGDDIERLQAKDRDNACNATQAEHQHKEILLLFGNAKRVEDWQGQNRRADVCDDVEGCVGEPKSSQPLDAVLNDLYAKNLPNGEAIETSPLHGHVPEGVDWSACKYGTKEGPCRPSGEESHQSVA